MERNQFKPEQTAWIEALESGVYMQCTGRLLNGNSYCCLGVALAANSTGHVELMDHGYLNDEQARLFWLRSDSGELPEEIDSQDSLVDLNDRAKWTFDQIAKLMREKPWLMFSNFDRPEGPTP